ncbi:MAG: heavy-metal-associated domain-containing protein [Bacteroidales bacterium]|nr:heavy-metal-associated domain-containing protein [Bacteroidales bacterium]
MKTITRIIALVALIAVSAISSGQDQKSTQQDKNLETVTFATSITCENCVNTIMGSLPKEKGIKDVKTDLETKTVTVTFFKDKNSTEQVKRNIEKLGFTAKPVPTEREKK